MSATIALTRASMLARASCPVASANRAITPLLRPANANAKVIASLPPLPRRHRRSTSSSSVVLVRASSSDDEVSTPVLAVAAAGLPASLIVIWSAYTKATTGAGLQGDVLGGLEGVSYLLTLALLGLSVKTKVSTGGGLPAGPGGVVGASEGLNYLALLAALGAFAYSAVNGN